ncbi:MULTISPECIES: PTS transporter subunit EIIB [Glaesserella]|uniref:PTS EIIB type-1 domain-containing protein n=1 Tax=Glaesserella australis TaxID=2094024 RepID=A0A328BXD9_9PAST|nr:MULTISPECIES: PTS glucose/sucrose transporter subunit IIB [Glaesserella]AUI66649.1 hypothetical protein CJD39_08720 [Glaesserella sp. 15-184]RAL18823.1 hypothetical protein C5N92_06745 [Glaesserella australis]
MVQILKNLFGCGKTAKDSSLSPEEIAPKIIDALGKAENIEHLDFCLTRLRVQLKSKENINRNELKALGAAEVVTIHDNHVHVIFGKVSESYANAINAILGK